MLSHFQRLLSIMDEDDSRTRTYFVLGSLTTLTSTALGGVDLTWLREVRREEGTMVSARSGCDKMTSMADRDPHKPLCLVGMIRDSRLQTSLARQYL